MSAVLELGGPLERMTEGIAIPEPAESEVPVVQIVISVEIADLKLDARIVSAGLVSPIRSDAVICTFPLVGTSKFPLFVIVVREVESTSTSSGATVGKLIVSGLNEISLKRLTVKVDELEPIRPAKS